MLLKRRLPIEQLGEFVECSDSACPGKLPTHYHQAERSALQKATDRMRRTDHIRLSAEHNLQDYKVRALVQPVQ